MVKLTKNEKEIALEQFIEKTGMTPLEALEQGPDMIGLGSKCDVCGKSFHLGEKVIVTSTGTVTDYDKEFNDYTSSDSITIAKHIECK